MQTQQCRLTNPGVLVFEYDFMHLLLNKLTILLAKNVLHKLHTIWHPDVLKLMDVIESEITILTMMEQVWPSSAVLQAHAVQETARAAWLVVTLRAALDIGGY